MDILISLCRRRLEEFTLAEVVAAHGIKNGEAHRRVSYLVTYGLVRPLAKLESGGRGRRPRLYGVTEWGRKYFKDMGKRST